MTIAAHDVDHWQQRISALLDGRLDDEARRQLDAALRDDPAVRAAYFAMMMLHCGMRRSAIAAAPTTTAADATPAGWTVGRWAVCAAAACVMLGVLAAISVVSQRDAAPARSGDAAGAVPHVAILSDLSDDARFDASAGAMNLGSELTIGPIRLAAGHAQVMFTSAAVVDLTGPCEFEMTGPNRARLISGRIDAYVRPEARGFAVDLPGGAKAIDLGTRFSAQTLPAGECQVRVTEGRVMLEITGGSSAYTLRPDFIATLAADGSLRSLRTDFTYVNATAGPGGNTVNIADGLTTTWSNDNANAGASRINTDRLWGSSPLEQGFDAMPNAMVWESSSYTEDAPAIRTTVNGLDDGTYEVFLLWASNTTQPAAAWPLRARLPGSNVYKTFAANGDIIETNKIGLHLCRAPLGKVTGRSLSVEVDDVPHVARARYLGFAYRRVFEPSTGLSEDRIQTPIRSSAKSVTDVPSLEKND